EGGKGEVAFVCSAAEGHLAELIEAQGYPVTLLPAGDDAAPFDWRVDARQTLDVLGTDAADWLVIDHYGIDSRWETMLRPRAKHIMVIDDLANRPHDCDVLLDQNYRTGLEHRYDRLVAPGCKKLLGLSYLLLRPEFIQARKSLRRDFSAVRRVLVNFGGMDEPNMSLRAIEAIGSLQLPALQVDVVIGQANTHQAALRQAIASWPGFTLHVQTDRMAELVCAADLAVGASGSSTWERCSLGLPSLAVVLADNQREAALELGGAGIIVDLGDAARVTAGALAAAIRRLVEDGGARAALSRRSLELVPADRPSVPEILMQVENCHA
ncbi:MAG: Pseudaminic acid cytidylyltransferase, partial [Polaromonas sp.]|nr:Pseudaminic acid cytidylyltransferase [Polaromonas sp.]